MAAASSDSKYPKQQRCSICGRFFDTAEALSAHQKMDHGQKSSPPAGVG